jgi:protoporphyrinogen oxidase
VERVTVARGRATGIVTPSGAHREFDEIISTMPLTKLLLGLPSVPDEVSASARSLRFRNTILVYLNVGGTDVFADQWIYVQEPNLRIGRITNFRNWSEQLYGKANTTILAAELWCNFDDPMWSERDETLIELAKREVSSTGLLRDLPILAGHVVRVPRCYPVYGIGYRESVAKVADHLRTIAGLQAIGRYGAFKYNNQDHSILMGLLAAENIVNGHQQDLWAVNSDYDVYQEAAIIDETGLRPTQ